VSIISAWRVGSLCGQLGTVHVTLFVSIRILIEDVVGDLLDLLTGLHFVKDRIRHELLLDQLVQFQRCHLQHLDPLPKLRSENHALL
jgi:hypothetical protein